jgi:uncharacterized protein DUF4339
MMAGMANQFWYTRNGVRAGPVDSNTLKQLASSGKLQRDDLVGKPEMQTWTRVDGIPELQRLLPATPQASHDSAGFVDDAEAAVPPSLVESDQQSSLAPQNTVQWFGISAIIVGVISFLAGLFLVALARPIQGIAVVAVGLGMISAGLTGLEISRRIQGIHIFGFIVMFSGLAIMLCGLSMDATVGSSMGGRLNNIVLLNQNTNVVICGAAIFLAGVINCGLASILRLLHSRNRK